MMALTHTDLPEPVVPAISRCGMAVRSAATAWPETSCPSARRSRESILQEGLGLHHVPQRHHLDLGVGHLDPDEALARHRRLDPDRRRRQRQRQIVGQRADLADLDLDPPAAAAFDEVGLDAELGDRRAAVDLDHAHRRPEGQQRFFDHAAALPVELLVGARLGALVENRGHRRE